jgi:hypothetical protein
MLTSGAPHRILDIQLTVYDYSLKDTFGKMSRKILCRAGFIRMGFFRNQKQDNSKEGILLGVICNVLHLFFLLDRPICHFSKIPAYPHSKVLRR